MFVPLSFWRLSESVKIIPPFNLAYYLSAGVFKHNNGISQMPMPAAFYFNSAIGDTQVNRIGWGEGKKKTFTCSSGKHVQSYAWPLVGDSSRFCLHLSGFLLRSFHDDMKATETFGGSFLEMGAWTEMTSNLDSVNGLFFI